MIYTYDYDAGYAFGPAIPVIEFQLRAIGKDQGVTIQALVDSGADVTILPLRYLKKADAAHVGRAKMRWGSHESRNYDVYLAVIDIGPHTVYGVRVLADKQNQEIILGRDVLNQIRVTLNGPALVVEIED
jgi:predicted aspartyl protease